MVETPIAHKLETIETRLEKYTLVNDLKIEFKRQLFPCPSVHLPYDKRNESVPHRDGTSLT